MPNSGFPKVKVGGTTVRTSISTQRPTPPVQDTLAAWDPTKWPATYGSAGSAWFSGGALVTPHVPSFSGGLATGAVFDLPGGHAVWAELVSGPTVGNGSKMASMAISSPSGALGGQFILRPNATPALYQLTCELNQGSNITYRTLVYDAVAHRWLRMRVAFGQLLWETSPDGKTWTIVAMAHVPTFLYSGSKASFQAGSWNNDTTQGYTTWRNFCVFPTS